jgi:hypothetical protein
MPLFHFFIILMCFFTHRGWVSNYRLRFEFKSYLDVDNERELIGFEIGSFEINGYF